MKYFPSRFSFLIVFSVSILLLNACFNDEDKVSIDKGPTALEAVTPETEEQGDVSSTMKLRAAPSLNTVSLDWDAVEGAVDYKVSRELQGSGDVVDVLTGGARIFSFTTAGKETYRVWVMAIDAQGAAISLSKEINVITTDPDAVVVSDQGL